MQSPEAAEKLAYNYSSYAGQTVTLSRNTDGSTLIHLQEGPFLPATRIAMPDGERAVKTFGSVVTPNDQTRPSTWFGRAHAVFSLPDDISDVRILSRTNRPCNVIRPFLDHRRNLGVLVGDVTLFENASIRQVTSRRTPVDGMTVKPPHALERRQHHAQTGLRAVRPVPVVSAVPCVPAGKRRGDH
ncbi:hypothetical protein JK191_10765 [Gluconobacter sphaericus]|uniref:hypothetical protein n=1 Tax=Gluconobacter sphaericus TaxID=574987 RepID=UPI001B8BF32B|nr:hypothetical protein [Gluconobacter sphaericus]MBS1098038.1 hypothetical protein [Gluconobacter sphaericus]